MWLDLFLKQLRHHECLVDVTAEMEGWIRDARMRPDKHTLQFLDGIEWIAGRTERTLVERLTMMRRLMSFDGPVVMSMKLFTGWT